MKKFWLISISVFVIIGFVSCNASTTVAAQPATNTPQPAATATTKASPTPLPAPTDTPMPVADIPAFLTISTSTDISAINSNDIWKIYSAPTSTTFNSSTKNYHFMHWNGSNWQFVADPQDITPGINFTSISADSSQDVWAVSSFGTEHWDGTQWNMTQTAPAPSGFTYSLDTVLALSGNDVWAAGMEQNNAQQGPEGTFPLIEHWDGMQWNVITLQTGIFGQLIDLGASSSSDVWAVGNFTSDGGFIEHWNGQTWSEKQINTVASNMEQIVVLSPTNVWASGIIVNPFAEHWDGAQWKIETPMPQNPQNYLNDNLIVTGSQNIWQMQNLNLGTAANPTFLQQWSGSSFTALPQLNIPGKPPVISDMQFINTNSYWVYGDLSSSGSSSQTTPWFAFWDGSSWTVYGVQQ